MLSDIEVENLTTIVTDHEKPVERAKPEGWNGEEVHRRDGFSVIPQKGEPTSSSLWVSWRSFHPAGDGSLGNSESQHEKLPVNARRAPRRIFGHHSEDQFPHFLRSLSSSDRPAHFGNQLPVQSEASPMPSDHRFRSDHDKRLFPSEPEPSRQYPEQL